MFFRATASIPVEKSSMRLAWLGLPSLRDALNPNREADAETTSGRVEGRHKINVTGQTAMDFNETTGRKVWALIASLPADVRSGIRGGGGLGSDELSGDAYTLVIVQQGPDAKRQQAEILRAFQARPEVLEGYGLRIVIRPTLRV
jgi:hypothetical protein